MSHFEHNIPGYELIRELGSGGMAVVYLAIQRSLDRKVAIKIMRRNIEDMDKFERRFLMEGRTMAKLPHRNIVAVYDIVKNDDNTYIAMEYLDGGTLSTKMKDGMSLGEAIAVIVQIAQSLQFAHEHGIVHRDLKPANIMFRDANTPVLTDFGIAKHQDAAATRLTQTGMLVGTPTYMSPEQINALDVDGRSDLYSLGILFYEMLTGQPPFQADTPIAVLMAHLTTPPPPLPAQFGDFQSVIDRCLAKNRDDRFPNLREMVKALKASVLNNQTLLARLQSDPNQSSSEQLRALGFSVSGDLSSAAGTSGEVRLPPSSRGQNRTPSGGVQGAYNTGADIQAMARGGSGGQGAPNRTLLYVGIAAVLLITVGVGGYFVFRPKPDGGALDAGKKLQVDLYLREIERLIKENKLLTPPEENAYQYLRGVMEIAPNYPGTLAAIAKFNGKLKDELREALDEKDGPNLDKANARFAQAKIVWEQDPDLPALRKLIDERQAGATQRQAIEGLLARADAATKAGHDLGPGGAYVILQEAKLKAPSDPKVKQELDALMERALAPAREALAKGDVATALAALKPGEGTSFVNETAYKAIRADIDKAVVAQETKVRLTSLLTRVDDEIRRGQLVQPQGDNAEETLAQAVAVDAASPEVKQRQQTLAEALVKKGQAGYQSGQYDVALQNANAALNVLPDFASANQLKQQAESKIGAAQAKAIAGLAAATQAENAGRFLSPANTSAKALLEAVLRDDPKNAEATKRLADLPGRIAESARERGKRGDLAGAQALLDEGKRAYPNDVQIAGTAVEVGKLIAENKAKAAREDKLAQIGQAINARPPKSDTLARAAADIAALLAADPKDAAALKLRQQWVDQVADGLHNAESSADVDQFAGALKAAQSSFINEPRIAALQSEVVTVRAKVAADEEARVAALAGELVINAYPWATVESVVGQDKKPVPLPADRTTPLTIKVPAGVYYVTFRHPQVARTATEVAQVSAKQRTSTATSFSSSFNSKDYLKRAGL